LVKKHLVVLAEMNILNPVLTAVELAFFAYPYMSGNEVANIKW
jgi:hypothetical protein